jgi:hypothetical protein
MSTNTDTDRLFAEIAEELRKEAYARVGAMLSPPLTSSRMKCRRLKAARI